MLCVYTVDEHGVTAVFAALVLLFFYYLLKLPVHSSGFAAALQG